MSRPQTIAHTKRQTVQNAAGQALERSYLYLLPSTWMALKALCAASGSPTSELIEQLILNAASGTLQDITNDSNTGTRPRN